MPLPIRCSKRTTPIRSASHALSALVWSAFLRAPTIQARPGPLLKTCKSAFIEVESFRPSGYAPDPFVGSEAGLLRLFTSQDLAVREVAGCPGERCRAHTERCSSKHRAARGRRDVGCSPLRRTGGQQEFDSRGSVFNFLARRLAPIARLRALPPPCFLGHASPLFCRSVQRAVFLAGFFA